LLEKRVINMEEKQNLFRKKTLDRISSPEQLTDYLRVTSPGVWLVLIAVLILLGSLIAWASIGTLETTSQVKVVVTDHTAEIVSTQGAELAGGMPLHISGQDAKVASAKKDEYGRSVGIAEVELPDGIYDGTVVTDETRPIEFLLKASN